MSIFRRRDQQPSANEGVVPTPTAAPWTPVSDLDPAPYYAPGMPSLHGEPPQATTVTDARVDPPLARPVETPVPQVAPVSRSGRNMGAAAAVGLSLLAIVLGTAWWSPLAFALLTCIISLIAVVEWRTALAKNGRQVPMVPVVLSTVGFMIATWYYGPEGLVVALMVGCAGTVAWRVVDERIENTLADSLASMLTLLWIPFLASFLVLLEFADAGWQRVLIVILAVAGADSGGLFAGMLFGRHPMAPRVSPKKTWEGFAGGLLLGTAVPALAAFYLYDGRWWIGALVGVACVFAATLGDLSESALKRDIQVKDMSSLLPGHGGIMDRLDSLLIAAPVAYVVFALLLGAR
jgi:phosphatidate cytidylyltransferase